MTNAWKDMTEEDIDRLLKEGVNVVGCDNGFQFSDNFKKVKE